MAKYPRIKNPKEITLRETHIKIFNFIKDYIAKNIVSPYYTEIAAGTGYTVQTVQVTINDLVALKYLQRKPMAVRGIKIAKEITSSTK